MADSEESATESPGSPGYKSRRILADELARSQAGYAGLLARLEALEAAKSDPTAAMVEALRQERETVLSARLQRELDEAKKQIEHLKRPETPSNGVPYSGWVQAKEDLWDGRLIRKGPSSEGPGEYFEISLPDYWPGCPFTPVVRHQAQDGSAYFTPHPDFKSH